MEQRDEIEMKLAWLEKYVSELDAVVQGLADEVVALRAEVAELRVRRDSDAPDEPGTDLAYEKPPHY